MAMNTRLLRKVKKHILAEPKRFRLSTWLLRLPAGYVMNSMYHDNLRNSWGEPEKYKMPKCGTVGCIAGWSCILSGTDPDEYGVRSGAVHALGLTDFSVGERLFVLDKWPAKFADTFKARKSHAGRAKVAAERIEHFIKTKGAE